MTITNAYNDYDNLEMFKKAWAIEAKEADRLIELESVGGIVSKGDVAKKLNKWKKENQDIIPKVMKLPALVISVAGGFFDGRADDGGFAQTFLDGKATIPRNTMLMILKKAEMVEKRIKKGATREELRILSNKI